MIYTFARVSAAVTMNVKDVYRKQETLWVRLHEKGGKHHEMPCQHNLKEWLQEYIEAAGLAEDPNGPLFRTVDRKTKQLGTTASTGNAPGRWSSGGRRRPASRRRGSATTPSGAPASRLTWRTPRPSWSTPSKWPRTRTRRPRGSMTGVATRSPSMRSSGSGFRAPQPGLADNIFRSMASGLAWQHGCTQRSNSRSRPSPPLHCRSGGGARLSLTGP